jgi:catechol 2,3-dioxygenase-like lactoylglutathione lyase family enzyme
VSDARIGRLPRLAQIGLVVDDMKRATSTYGSILGVRRWYRSRMTSFEVAFRGERTVIDWDIVVGYTGRVQVELILIRRAGNNIYDELLGPGGTGFHHLGVEVRDFDRRLRTARQSGLEIAQHGRIRFAGGATCRFAYLDTFDELGFVLELIEMKVYGLQLGMPEWLLRVGVLTGDVERIGRRAAGRM